ncbi:MAG: glycine zipper 2TM domain-containing protein [Chitinophagaceae bacterium]|nr:MAG: glycine zipper 2TM domain-containing protein [Chitinophagaceae bacterium]
MGGVVGAGTGAIVNKKNRVAGAVIGGVIGAGTGAVIGNQMDKKDGRH